MEPKSTGEPASTRQIEALGELSDPVRRRIFERIGEAPGGLSREEICARTGIKPSLAAYHLGRLTAKELVTVHRERRGGRSGPGAGRPANIYSRTRRETTASVPPREYGLLAELLTEAVGHDRDGAATEALMRAARRVGREAGASAAGAGSPRAVLLRLLRERGYEPVEDDDGTIRLRNCPFHTAAARNPEVICGMNLELLDGMAGELGQPGTEAVLEPAEGLCCVTIRIGPQG